MSHALRSAVARPLRAAVIATMLPVLAPLAAQAPSFLFTASPVTPTGTFSSFVHADVGYGERVFGSVAAERAEQVIGAQLRLAPRVMMLARSGLRSSTSSDPSALDLRAEVLANLLGRDDRRVLAVGAGVGREYSHQALALGRVVLGYRGDRWEAMSNLRAERAVGRTALAQPRDGIDVITTMGVVHSVGSSLRVGMEAVSEDIEGFFDREEAEGGAKLMLGPTLTVAPAAARWRLLLGAGPIWRLTQSASLPSSGVSRDLTSRSGYLLRASMAWRW